MDKYRSLNHRPRPPLRTSPSDVVAMNRPRLVWAICSVIAVVILLMGAGVVYTNYRIDQNNKKACGMYNIVYRSTLRNPLPTDPAARRNTIEFRKELNFLRQEYHCEKVEDILDEAPN